MVIRVLGILCVGVAHQSNKSTQLEITNAEALVTLVHLLRTSRKALIQVGLIFWRGETFTGEGTITRFPAAGRTLRANLFFCDWPVKKFFHADWWRFKRCWT